MIQFVIMNFHVGSVSMISLVTGPENTMTEIGNHHLSSSLQSASENKENIEQHSSSSTSSGKWVYVYL